MRYMISVTFIPRENALQVKEKIIDVLADVAKEFNIQFRIVLKTIQEEGL